MKKLFVCISIAVVLIAGCKTKSVENSTSEGSKTTDLVVNPDALVVMDVSVEGMTCTGCENTINTGVSGIPGVVEVKSTFQEGKTVVKYDTTQTDMDKIAEVINGKGYSVKGYALHAAEAEADTTK